MSGRITFRPTPASQHDRNGCDIELTAEAYPDGTIWTCDECGQEWVVVSGAQYNEPYTAWRRLTEKNREGRDL